MIDHMTETIFILIAHLIVWIRPALPIICATLAWSITAVLLLSIVTMVRQGLSTMRQLHRIPCSSCRYATKSYRLKCPVYPIEAFSEQSIGCPDFEPKDVRPRDLAHKDLAHSSKRRTAVLSNFFDLT
jgi:hypothetical protein